MCFGRRCWSHSVHRPGGIRHRTSSSHGRGFAVSFGRRTSSNAAEVCMGWHIQHISRVSKLHHAAQLSPLRHNGQLGETSSSLEMGLTFSRGRTHSFQRASHSPRIDARLMVAMRLLTRQHTHVISILELKQADWTHRRLCSFFASLDLLQSPFLAPRRWPSTP
jgi:hypothetical protein